MGISIGLVGLGAFGSGFAGLFKSHPLVDRVALCDREVDRSERFAKHPYFQDKLNTSDVYESLDEICESDLDAIVLITQPWLHAEQAVQVMKSGKSVYSAVPIVSIPDGNEILDWCDKLVATCRETGKHYMLGETTYYRPEAMYCRRKYAEGAFGHVVYAEGEYYHDVDSPGCNLRDVAKHRRNSKAGREWIERSKQYKERGVVNGPMHYPTHSTCGPVCAMNAHAVSVSAFGFSDPDNDPYFNGDFSNETGLFKMSNGASVRINEFRQIGLPGEEIFRVFGSQASFRERGWCDKSKCTDLSIDEMRDKLPDEVMDAYRDWIKNKDAGGSLNVGYKDKDFEPAELDRKVYGGHGGSHAYLVHEFVEAVAQDRHPAINIWEASRYMAMGVMAHKSALKGGELLDVPDWGDAPA